MSRLPDHVLQHGTELAAGMCFHGWPLESLTREELIAAIGIAVKREQDTTGELRRRTDFLLGGTDGNGLRVLARIPTCPECNGVRLRTSSYYNSAGSTEVTICDVCGWRSPERRFTRW